MSDTKIHFPNGDVQTYPTMKIAPHVLKVGGIGYYERSGLKKPHCITVEVTYDLSEM